MNGKSTRPTTICTLCALAPLAVALATVGHLPEAAGACGDCTCNICVGPNNAMTIDSSVTADCIEVETGGTLTIEGNGRLTLTGPGPSCVDGQILLSESGSTLEFTTNDHEVSCSGKIKGQSNNAVIRIASRVTLTSDVKITGRLRITGAGAFLNEGSVTADRLGTLDIEVTGGVDDNALACWEVAAAGARLRFLTEPACLDGDFKVSDGTLRAGTDISSDDIDVVTTGNLTHTGGNIVAGVDDSFTFNLPTCPE